jgi:hypothetical protein
MKVWQTRLRDLWSLHTPLLWVHPPGSLLQSPCLLPAGYNDWCWLHRKLGGIPTVKTSIQPKTYKYLRKGNIIKGKQQTLLTEPAFRGSYRLAGKDLLHQKKKERERERERKAKLCSMFTQPRI